MSRIALISTSTLETIALRQITDRESDALCHHFQTFPEFASECEKFDAYIVAESVFVANLDFFMPKKARLIVISATNTGGVTSLAKGHEAKTHPLHIIGFDSDLSDICEMISELTESLNEDADATGGLSIRETEVLRQLASGRTNKEIADILCISVNTVITHRKNISSKLGIKSVSGLSLYALMNGLI